MEETETNFDVLFEVHREIIMSVHRNRIRLLTYSKKEFWEQTKDIWRKYPTNALIIRINQNIEKYNLPLNKYKLIEE